MRTLIGFQRLCIQTVDLRDCGAGEILIGGRGRVRCQYAITTKIQTKLLILKDWNALIAEKIISCIETVSFMIIIEFCAKN